MNKGQNNTVPTAEIKLGLNLAKETVKVLTTDSEEEEELKMALVDIDEALKSGDQERISVCNRTITQRYGYILFTPLTTFRRITETEWRNLSFAEQFYTMRSAGDTLHDALNLKKFAKGFYAGAKVAGEYIFDKALDKLKTL